MDYYEIGKRIKQKRKFLNLTQESVAEYLDVNPSHISNIETGRTNPSLTLLVGLANFFGCSVDYFISGEYTFDFDSSNLQPVDEKIQRKLKACNDDKKERILKMIDLM